MHLISIYVTKQKKKMTILFNYIFTYMIYYSNVKNSTIRKKYYVKGTGLRQTMLTEHKYSALYRKKSDVLWLLNMFPMKKTK